MHSFDDWYRPRNGLEDASISGHDWLADRDGGRVAARLWCERSDHSYGLRISDGYVVHVRRICRQHVFGSMFDTWPVAAARRNHYLCAGNRSRVPHRVLPGGMCVDGHQGDRKRQHLLVVRATPA